MSKKIEVKDSTEYKEEGIAIAPTVEVEENNKNPVIYIFLNKSLGMSVGKAAAQAAHAAVFAAAESDTSEQQLWRVNPHKTIIVLEARNEEHLRSISTYLQQRGFYSNMIVDEGVNEIDPHTITALSTCIIDKNNDHTKQTFSTFSLYKGMIEINLRVDR